MKRLLMPSLKWAVPVCLLVVVSLMFVTGDASTRTSSSPTVVSEYERSLERVLVSTDLSGNGLKPHIELIASLPGYTEVIVLTPEEQKESVSAQLRALGISRKIELVSYGTKRVKGINLYMVFPEKDKLVETGPLDERSMPFGSIWAQDLMEPVMMPGGKVALLISDVYKWFESLEGHGPEAVLSDNSFVSSLGSLGMEVRRLPITFRGGNILFDTFRGKKIAFAGGDVLRLTRTVWKGTRDQSLTEDQVRDMIKRYFNVDEVHFIGKETAQPSLMFHLDQAMVFLGKGVVGLTKVMDSSAGKKVDNEVAEVKRHLKELRDLLTETGYTIVDLEASEDDVLHMRYYANSIPYTDRLTGKHSIIMPEFPSSSSPLERPLFQGNISRIKELGYQVTLVPTEINTVNGGLHCMLNVIR